MITLTSQKSFSEDAPVIFLTGRVHCGETPASYMLQGVIDKLTDFDDR